MLLSPRVPSPCLTCPADRPPHTHTPVGGRPAEPGTHSGRRRRSPGRLGNAPRRPGASRASSDCWTGCVSLFYRKRSLTVAQRPLLFQVDPEDVLPERTLKGKTMVGSSTSALVRRLSPHYPHSRGQDDDGRCNPPFPSLSRVEAAALGWPLPNVPPRTAPTWFVPDFLSRRRSEAGATR